MIITKYSFHQLCKQLGDALQKELPGHTSHLKMASRLRLEAMNKKFDLSLAEKCAVLVLLYPFDGNIYFPLILRPAYDGIHASQVSFPGGRMELSDVSLYQTAMREAEEELNIKAGEIQILGRLTDVYIPPSNFLVSPIVGFSDSKPNFIPDPVEVEQVILADLNKLFDPRLTREKTIQVRNLAIHAPYYDIDGQTVWGATAMILSELKDIIEKFD